MELDLVDAQFESVRAVIDRLEIIASALGVEFDKAPSKPSPRSKNKSSPKENESKVKVVNGRRIVHIDDLSPEDLFGSGMKVKTT